MQKDYELVLFDLDGTLTDPGVGITNSVSYALERFGIHVSDRTELYKFIGPPLMESFNRFYGFSKEESRQAIAYYREYYVEKGMLENCLYDGIEELLSTLVKGGKRLCLATAKPEPFARMILDHFELSRYFEYIAGATLDETRIQKHEVISYALEQCKMTDTDRVIMIGDRAQDVLGAAKHGIACIGVLFGYGSREELEHAGAAYLAETVADIAPFILQR